MPNPVDYAHKYPICDGMGPLNGAPCIMLDYAEFGFFVGMPADGCGIKKDICALQSSQPRAFRIPLVPADQRPHAPIFSIKSLESQIARSEIKLLVIERIIRNVHFAIKAFGASISIQHHSSIVIKTARPPFK